MSLGQRPLGSNYFVKHVRVVVAISPKSWVQCRSGKKDDNPSRNNGKRRSKRERNLGRKQTWRRGQSDVEWLWPFSVASPYQDMVFEKVPFYLVTCPQHYTNHVLILILES